MYSDQSDLSPATAKCPSGSVATMHCTKIAGISEPICRPICGSKSPCGSRYVSPLKLSSPRYKQSAVDGGGLAGLGLASTYSSNSPIATPRACVSTPRQASRYGCQSKATSRCGSPTPCPSQSRYSASTTAATLSRYSHGHGHSHSGCSGASAGGVSSSSMCSGSASSRNKRDTIRNALSTVSYLPMEVKGYVRDISVRQRLKNIRKKLDMDTRCLPSTVTYNLPPEDDSYMRKMKCHTQESACRRAKTPDPNCGNDFLRKCQQIQADVAACRRAKTPDPQHAGDYGCLRSCATPKPELDSFALRCGQRQLKSTPCSGGGGFGSKFGTKSPCRPKSPPCGGSLSARTPSCSGLSAKTTAHLQAQRAGLQAAAAAVGAANACRTNPGSRAVSPGRNQNCTPASKYGGGMGRSGGGVQNSDRLWKEYGCDVHLKRIINISRKEAACRIMEKYVHERLTDYLRQYITAFANDISTLSCKPWDDVTYCDMLSFVEGEENPSKDVFKALEVAEECLKVEMGRRGYDTCAIGNIRAQMRTFMVVSAATRSLISDDDHENGGRSSLNCAQEDDANAITPDLLQDLCDSVEQGQLGSLQSACQILKVAFFLAAKQIQSCCKKNGGFKR